MMILRVMQGMYHPVSQSIIRAVVLSGRKQKGGIDDKTPEHSTFQ
jgi:hypothetical protein